MKTSTEERNAEWLRLHAEEYPWATITEVRRPQPDGMRFRMPEVEFVRAPLRGGAVWMFETRADREHFNGMFRGEDFDLTTL